MKNICKKIIGTKSSELHRISIDGITRSKHGKFNCITANFEQTQHGI